MTLFLPLNNNCDQKKIKGWFTDHDLYVQQEWSSSDSSRPDICCDASLRLIGQDRYGLGCDAHHKPPQPQQAGRHGKVWESDLI